MKYGLRPNFAMVKCLLHIYGAAIEQDHRRIGIPQNFDKEANC